MQKLRHEKNNNLRNKQFIQKNSPLKSKENKTQNLFHSVVFHKNLEKKDRNEMDIICICHCANFKVVV